MIQKNDFVEINFTGKISDSGEIFDTTIPSDAKKAKLDLKDLKPFIACVSQKMLPAGFDEDLLMKELGKEYTVKLSSEKAFGKRNPQMVRMIPTKLFHAQNIDPQRGMQLALDGQLVKILSSSSGRTLVDFNNPLAGRNVEYSYTIMRKVEDMHEKINALQDFLFRKKFDFELKEKTIIFKVQKGFEPFIKLFAGKFEEMLGLKIESQVLEEKKNSEEKKEEKTAEVKA